MVVQHNLSAMNSNRMLSITQGTLSKSAEKLSSGYKINRAADDAAGLSISEKMRKQIRGLTQASSNAEDGISAVQTAEGALTEVHDMLQRMNELAVKSANGTNSEDDRSYIQDEIDQLSQEIDRVAETTKFNETYLLKGDTTSKNKEYSFSYKSAALTAATVSMGTPSGDVTSVTVKFENAGKASEQNALAKAIRDQGLSITASTVDKATVIAVELNGSDAKSNYKVVGDGKAGNTTYEVQNSDGTKIATISVTAGAGFKGGMSSSVTATSVTSAYGGSEGFSYYDKDGNAIAANDLSNYFTGSTTSTDPTPRADAPKVYDALGKEQSLDKSKVSQSKDLTPSLKLKFHVGADGTSNNQITINIDALNAKGLGINGLKVDGTDDTNATKAVSAISAAIKKVSTQRSALGAVQNRLEHTINNLNNIVENTTSAESSIRDTDMATEMVTYSNANILSQAGQSMLAQSNQTNQGVLSLLG
jgi:flagellin